MEDVVHLSGVVQVETGPEDQSLADVVGQHRVGSVVGLGVVAAKVPVGCRQV